MINVITLVQLKAFARQDGALLSLVWIASFACLIWLTGSPLNSLLLLSTPFVVGWRLIAFRDQALGGVISYRRALAYCVYVFFYASLVFALVQFLYFRFLDNGLFLGTITDALSQVRPVYEQAGIDMQPIDDSLAAIKALSPIEFSFLIMMQNLFIGFALSFLIALAGRRRMAPGQTSRGGGNNQA